MKNKENKLKDLLKELFALAKTEKFADITLKDGSILRTSDDTLVKGSQVKLVSVDGVESEAPEGDVTSNDGSVITIKSGVVDSITSAPLPTEDPSAMSVPVVAPKTETAPSAEIEIETETEKEMNSMDMENLLTLMKNLVERVAALESSISSTAMTVEKMAAAPAAKPFNFDPYGENTIGSELEKYKAEHKAKASAREKALLEFSSKRKVETPMEFSAIKTNKVNPSTNNAPILFPGSFSIDGGK